jgi:hypothetical protein
MINTNISATSGIVNTQVPASSSISTQNCECCANNASNEASCGRMVKVHNFELNGHVEIDLTERICRFGGANEHSEGNSAKVCTCATNNG